MSKKRGLSLEEKRTKMVELFHEKKEFLLLKEVEKVAFKEKGIVSQSVKDVLQSLVDDDMINSDKIGSSVYFWSFPSNSLVVKKKKLNDLSSKIDSHSRKKKELHSVINDLSKDRTNSSERKRMLERLQLLKQKKDALELKLREYKDSDPEHLAKLKSDITISKESTNRWTDNTFALQSWIQNNFPSISINDLNKQFEIPEDMDYIE